VLREAYQLAKNNNGAPGVDGVTFEQVEREGIEPMLECLSQELREKSYVPLPCRHVNIPKEGGKVRALRRRLCATTAREGDRDDQLNAALLHKG
jgi:RNA-directed DNA polymerase